MPFSPGVLFLAQRSVTLEHVKWLLFPEMREAERKRERRRVGGGGGEGRCRKKELLLQPKDAGCSTNGGETNFIIRPHPTLLLSGRAWPETRLSILSHQTKPKMRLRSCITIKLNL